MSPSIAHIATEVGVAVEDLTVWVERRWILPARHGTELAFDTAASMRREPNFATC